MVEESNYEDLGADEMNQATRLARVIVCQIIEAGITDAVISPGSRNAPLSLALVTAQDLGLIKLHIRIDERTAAFYALGLAKATNRPVPVICTSGTAVANYHPAVLEASHSNVPLFVITADRPAELRRTGANQTTEQARIFGKAVRYFADVSGAVYPLELPLNALQTGPVHLNVQFEEPLIGNADTAWLDGLKVSPPRKFDRKKAGTLASKSTRGLLVIGHDRGGLAVEEVAKFAEQLGWPILSEDPLTFPNANAHASLFLTSITIAKDLAPDTVIVIGRTTLSRSVNALINLARATFVIDPRIATVDSDRMAEKKFTELPELYTAPADPEWLAKWNKYSERTSKVVKEMSAWSEPLIAREISQHLPDGATLFISSSRPIRDIEAFGAARHGVKTFANRGLAGIDGNISTALGIATAHSATFAVLGDLAFLHDITGLIHREEINLRIFVINNDGGGIFSTLPQRGSNGFEQVFGTPHGLDPAAIAKAMGLDAKVISSVDQLRDEIKKPISGVSVVVCDVPSRESNADLIKSLYAKMESI
jgi:2-succinyl-5-enolpyruvyl-6-hydroxy-3-cyclohexene-1-carboxylate synthase